MMKVLVVDDERDIQTLFEQKFRKEISRNTLQFVFAFSGFEALDYLNKVDHNFRIMLTDLNMPGMSGLELMQHVKKRNKSNPLDVVVITAYSDDDNHHAVKALGAKGMLTKPLDFRLLKEKLNSLV